MSMGNAQSLERSKSPSGQNAPLAQLVEQLTLNQWVRGSSPRRCTNIKAMPRGAWFDVHTLSRYEKPDERIRRILLADVERSDTRQGFEFPETVSIFNAKGPPVPIPNTEVKLCSADNTCLETSRKDRSWPIQTKQESALLSCLPYIPP